MAKNREKPAVERLLSLDSKVASLSLLVPGAAPHLGLGPSGCSCELAAGPWAELLRGRHRATASRRGLLGSPLTLGGSLLLGPLGALLGAAIGSFRAVRRAV